MLHIPPASVLGSVSSVSNSFPAFHLVGAVCDIFSPDRSENVQIKSGGVELVCKSRKISM